MAAPPSRQVLPPATAYASDTWLEALRGEQQLDFSALFTDVAFGVTATAASVHEVVGPDDFTLAPSTITITGTAAEQLTDTTWACNFTVIMAGAATGAVHWLHCQLTLSDLRVLGYVVGLREIPTS